jgi:hypothetical protein
MHGGVIALQRAGTAQPDVANDRDVHARRKEMSYKSLK